MSMRFAPLFIGVSMLVFGLITNNLTYLMVFIGMAIAIPIVVYILYFVFDGLLAKKFPSMVLFEPDAKNDYYGSMFPAKGDGNLPPYMWYSMITFLMTYLFINALDIYNYDVKNISQTKEDARKTKAVVGMIASSIVLIVMLYFRSTYMAVSETPLGQIILALAAGSFAYSWHSFLASCSSPKKNVHLDDLYSVKNNIISAVGDVKKICVAREN